MHNFKKCRSCGSPVKGNRFYCDKTECQRRAAADRKARSRAGKTRKAAKPVGSVEVDDQGDGGDWEDFLNSLVEPPGFHDWPTAEDYERAGMTEDGWWHWRDVGPYLIEVMRWKPGMGKPPHLCIGSLPPNRVEDFRAWLARRDQEAAA